MAFWDVIVNPLTALFSSIVLTIPSLIGAVIVLLVGYLVAFLAHWVVVELCSRAKLDHFIAKKTNMQRTIGAFSVSNFLALLAKWYTFILFLPAAANTLSGNMVNLANFLAYVGLWIPKLIAGLFVAAAGLMAANYVEIKLKDLKFKSAGFLGGVSKWVIIFFAGLMALNQIGFNVRVAENTFLLIVAGVVLAVSLAVGISCGVALQDDAKKILKSISKKIKA